MAGKKGKYVEVDHEGKLYRVRDKDFGKPNETTIIWGENLSWEAANRLKEKIVGAGKTQTARVVPMEDPDPTNAVTPRGVPIAEGRQAAAARQAPPSLILPSTPPPSDPVIADAQRRAMAAARTPAAQAQMRAAQGNLVPLPQHAQNPAPAADAPIEIEMSPDALEGELEDLVSDSEVG